jgi:hypothetical protein
MNTTIPQTSPARREPSFQAARHTDKSQPSRKMSLHPRRREPSTAITFAPLAWLKLLMFLHAGDTEVGGFGISSEKRPLYIEDFVTVKQTVSAVTVAFDDTAVADYFDDCIDRGLTPARFARIWAHTHPGESPDPSSVDEETFHRVFGSCDWAVMLIVSRMHKTYARLSFSAGPGGAVLLPVNVDWATWPQVLIDRGGELSATFETWMDEYGKNICFESFASGYGMPLYSHEDRAAWAGDLWREDDIYFRHEQLSLDNEFATYFETIGMEER